MAFRAQYSAFQRVPQARQLQRQQKTFPMPAPVMGLAQAYSRTAMPAGSALALENFRPTMQGVRARAGSLNWSGCFIPEVPEDPGPAAPAIMDGLVGGMWVAKHGSIERMFASTLTKVWDVSGSGAALEVASGRTSPYNFAAQLTNAGNNAYTVVVNSTGDQPLLYDVGANSWRVNTGERPPIVHTPSMIYGPTGTPEPVYSGRGLAYVWKYRSRLYFIQAGSMDAWCLPVNAVGGQLSKIPLSAAVKKGGSLLFGCVWSLDAGDGLDDKCCFVTTEGEVAVFSGGDPNDPTNWKQEGRYDIGRPLGANANIRVGGDVLIATADGIIPLSSCINKDPAALMLDAVSRQIQTDFRHNMFTRATVPWDLVKWDEGGLLFLSMPTTSPGDDRYCYVANLQTGAWAKYTNWDMVCGTVYQRRFYFGATNGWTLQGEVSGSDNGQPYTVNCTWGWTNFGKIPRTYILHQLRANFEGRYQMDPKITCYTDYKGYPTPSVPNSTPDPGVGSLWDQGLWDVALWDATAPTPYEFYTTRWISIGETGYAHAVCLQVTFGQVAPPEFEIVSIDLSVEEVGDIV